MRSSKDRSLLPIHRCDDAADAGTGGLQLSIEGKTMDRKRTVDQKILDEIIRRIVERGPSGEDHPVRVRCSGGKWDLIVTLTYSSSRVEQMLSI